MADRWTTADIPAQRGRVAVVTGANSGLGLIASGELARAGASVIMACRNTDKGKAAAERIRDADPDVELKVAALDLADLSSVRSFAAEAPKRIDLLINNAGVMAPPRRLTKDGFESQLGTNHLGHFALTGLLLGRLLAASEPRVVTESSGAHHFGRISFDNLQGERHYMRWLAYGQSKLANLMFAFELQRRADEAGAALKSLAAHPGYARTNLQFAAPPLLDRAVMHVSNAVFAQSAEMGALPTLYAATAPDVPGGSFIGPDGFMEQRGYPHVVSAAGRAYDREAWRRLWEVSEELTGVHYEFAGAPAPA
ncbi:MAG TPA: oxidoreductase [Solirubrobacteraceae bacterium]|nr:oxidoreductase [Solirubrobacteraceae bacterium]